MNGDSKRLDAIPGRVIGCAFTVANTPGAGFLEKFYENALAHELTEVPHRPGRPCLMKLARPLACRNVG
jgi:GxxExxY protein